MTVTKQNVDKKNWIKTIIVWLPSILVAMFFVQNAFEKIFKSTELDKVGLSSAQIIIAGVILLIATTMYLIDRTMIIGSVVLALYMIGIVGIHIQKGKPFIIAGIIVIAVGYGSYLRKVKITH